MNKITRSIAFDVFLGGSLTVILFVHYLKLFSVPTFVFIFFAVIGFIPVAVSAAKSLLHRQLNIDLLASVALIFSYLAGEWTSGAFINLMLVFARIFSNWTDIRTRHTVEKLLKYRPEIVRIKKENQVVEIKNEDVKVGDTVIVDTGERIPVDGVVISGQAGLNESSLTGESEAVTKKEGDLVYTSTLIESGSLLIRAEKVGGESRLAKIISLVEEATRNKAQTERIAGKFTQWYIIIVSLGAVLLYYYLHNLNLVLAVLLVVCADDIAVAVPLSFTSSIIKAAQLGVLIKGADVVEKLPKIKYVITDKTGTLTKGKPVLASLHVFGKVSQKDFYRYLCIASQGSRHPISQVIVSFVKKQEISCPLADSYSESPGEGVTAVFDRSHLVIGKLGFLTKNGVRIPVKERTVMEKYEQDGFGLSALGRNGKLIGFVAIEDGIKPNAARIIAQSKKLGVNKWIMLTGDNATVAKRVAREVGIDEFESNIAAEEKYHFVADYKAGHPGILAVMGDGVNDAAALALADVSIAMGSIGSDAAIEASDVALMTDNLNKVPLMMEIGLENQKIVNQVFVIWGITNAVGLLLVFTGVLDPSLAAAYNFATDFLPIANSVRINFFRPKYL